MLGGLFPMHEDGSSAGKHCGMIKSDRGIHRLEGMLYAIDTINSKSNTELLPGLTLGVLALDTCNQDTHALEQTLEFVKSAVTTTNVDQYVCAGGASPIYKPTQPIAIVVGAASSQVSAMVANVLRLFKIPQISYSSTSVELSDKARFEYFARVVPADNYQAQAMVDIVDRFGWTYVSGVADEGTYGESGMETFRNLASEIGICLAAYEKIRRNFQMSDFEAMIRRLRQTQIGQVGARGVIMFVGEDNIKKILVTVKLLGLENHFVWVASDNWGRKTFPVGENPDVADGAITLMPKMTPIPDFDTYFLSLGISNPRNAWWGEYLRAENNCSIDEATECEILITASDKYEQEVFVPFVIDAVYTAAHALHALFVDECGVNYNRTCALNTELHGYKLVDHIRNVSFTSMQGNEVDLDSKGDRLGQYDIYQFHADTKKYTLIGEWQESLYLNMTEIIRQFDGKMPESVCREICHPNQRQTLAVESCCWYCKDCSTFQIVFNNTECLDCSVDTVPNVNYTECIPKKIEKMEWISPWSIVPGLFAAVGVGSCCSVVYVFYRFNKTPIIMASGRELCYIMLAGILASYCMTFVLLATPSLVFCTTLRIGMGFCLSLCYGAILTKTNRLERIFSPNIRKSHNPSCIRPRSQVLICAGICSVQLAGTLIWAIIEPPAAVVTHPDRRTAVLSCHQTTYALILPLCYNALLIVLCTVYAVKTRKIPENFNETKHIGFTMYSTCIVWCAFGPIYFGTNNFRIQITSLCMCTSISATIPLICFFAPKVYICLFQPHKNVRPPSRAQQMGFLHQQMRFVHAAIPPGILSSNAMKLSPSNSYLPSHVTGVSDFSAAKKASKCANKEKANANHFPTKKTLSLRFRQSSSGKKKLRQTASLEPSVTLPSARHSTSSSGLPKSDSFQSLNRKRSSLMSQRLPESETIPSINIPPSTQFPSTCEELSVLESSPATTAECHVKEDASSDCVTGKNGTNEANSSNQSILDLLSPSSVLHGAVPLNGSTAELSGSLINIRTISNSSSYADSAYNLDERESVHVDDFLSDIATLQGTIV